MPPLRRHQLVQLTEEGWRRVRSQSSEMDADARACLAHWATRRLPLVVTRQPPGHGTFETADDDTLALGLPAPLCWRRRRIALQVPRHHVAWFDEFPDVDELAPLLPLRTRPAWHRLCASLASLGAKARVYGSHGWQRLSGLAYLRAGSDVDLWAAVDDARQADAAAAVLDGFDDTRARRLDGELVFPDGRAFAWREWRAWRAGHSRAILCKTLCGVSLVWAGEERAVTPNAAEAAALP